jgi:N4-gp56 family major capsid protein
MANTTRTQVPAEVNNFYDRTLLMRAVPLYVHGRFAQTRSIPRNAGSSTIKFRRYTNLTAATTALTEGTTPSGSQLAVTDITATVAQYGDFVTITDVLNYESADPVLMETAELLGDQAGNTLDQITRDVIVAGTNVQYASTATSRVTVAAAMKMSVDEVKEAVRTLKNNNTMRVTKMVAPSTGYNSEPIDAAFVGIVHPDTTYDLQGLTGFVPVEKYASHSTVMEGEVGKLNEVRFVETTNAKVFSGAGASSIDVYATLIMGANAYGTVAINGESLKNIVKPLGSAGSADPLDQRATSGWKATHTAKILNDDFIVRIEHAVS